jgi:hypothetical protein
MAENTTMGSWRDHLKNLSQDWHGMTKLAVNHRLDLHLTLVILKCESEVLL